MLFCSFLLRTVSLFRSKTSFVAVFAFAGDLHPSAVLSPFLLLSYLFSSSGTFLFLLHFSIYRSGTEVDTCVIVF